MPEKRRCGARKKTGGFCTQPLREFQLRCRFHGGESPNALAGEHKRAVEHRAQMTLARLGENPDDRCTDAVSELERLAKKATNFVDAIEPHVTALQEVAYRGGLGEGVEQVRGELTAYLSALDHAHKYLTSIIKLDLDARRVRIQEIQVRQAVAGFDRALKKSGLPPEEQRRLAVLLAAELGHPQVIEVTAEIERPTALAQR